MSSSDDIKNLIAEKNRRLQKLKEQEARFGPRTQPEVLMEIEDIEAEIEQLELQEIILDDSNSNIVAQEAFLKFNQQIKAYLDKFSSLHKQLEDWKNVHNTLQDLQNDFAFYRRYIPVFDKSIQEKNFYEIEVEWRPCRRRLSKLQLWADNIHQLLTEIAETLPIIGQTNGLEGSSNPWEIAREIDKALNKSNAMALAEGLSTFGDLVDQLLYRADRKLLDLVGEINRLAGPSFI